MDENQNNQSEMPKRELVAAEDINQQINGSTNIQKEREQSPNTAEPENQNIIPTTDEFARANQYDENENYSEEELAEQAADLEDIKIRQFISAIAKYLIGALGILLVSTTMALFMNELMISHSSEYFGGLKDIFSLSVSGPVTLIVFGIIALLRLDWVFLLYPPVVFFLVGPDMLSDSVVKNIASQIGHHSTQFPSQTMINTVAIVSSYMLVYTVEHGISYATRRGRFKNVPKY